MVRFSPQQTDVTTSPRVGWLQAKTWGFVQLEAEVFNLFDGCFFVTLDLYEGGVVWYHRAESIQFNVFVSQSQSDV